MSELHDITYAAFADELEKIAGLRDLWQRFLDLFRGRESKAKRRSEYFFSPKAGKEKWTKFIRDVRDPAYLKRIKRHPGADETLKLHASSMHDLSRGRTVGKIKSSRLTGRTYEVKKLPGDKLGCTCGDWRFKGSVNPGYECKHIRAFRQGKLKAD